MTVPAIVGLCFAPSALFGAAVVGVWLYDRRRDRGACQRIVALTLREEREGWDRLCSGAAWVEAMALTLDDIQSLPEIEPWQRWVF